MKKIISLIGMLALSTLFVACSSDSEDAAPLAAPNPDLNLNGNWTVVETVGKNDCGAGFQVGSPWDNFDATVSQSKDGATITITNNSVSPPEIVIGTLAGNSIVGLPLDSYPQFDGTITETAISLTVDVSGDVINGTISVKWTDNVDSCSGRINVVATRDLG